jgi:ATP-dependent exoDNAse (exonuclease V) alpha subunit
MAIFHMNIKIITRGAGKSAVAAAAYRSGETLTNEYDGVTHDYTHKSGIFHSEILLPPNAPQEFSNRSVLWNSVEKTERYKTAQLAREIGISLPRELSREESIELARRFVQDTFVDKGCVRTSVFTIKTKATILTLT